ncbi:hypothetical protein GALMADRAFT_67782 [Galerina marginata CBS 339.88]|uniref:DUF155 domain-containing protein n=1 Tax=Galerina marginata (strain CBS 339.88) TaxID=685588 RepID=A0A067TB68_GALM3|nr:hypothetical protein GALMADRAFT_67782 [Galerina marginata CBS 339.88]
MFSRNLSRACLPTFFTSSQCRYFGTTGTRSKSVEAKTENPLSDAKAKPKSTTPLRRSASASLPIRSNPTPTRGVIQPIFTLATAERFILSRLRSHPDLPARSQALHESWWIPKWGELGKEGEVFVFSNGNIVCWGLGEAEAKRFHMEVIQRARGIEVASLKEPETEELEFVVDPIDCFVVCRKTRLQGDLIILGQTDALDEPDLFPKNLPPMALPEETLLARYAFSQALSRSTALSALEEELDHYLTSMALLPHALAETGKIGMTRTQLIKKLGALMKFRQLLNLNRENFSEVPDFYWAEPVLEGYFTSLSDALEVKARTSSLNDKITYAVDIQSMLRQLLTESSTHSMELIIIALIAVEVVIALIRDGPELWHMLAGSDSEDSEKKPAHA